MSAALWNRIVTELTSAMKAREELRTSVLRGLKSDLKYKEIELGKDLTDDDCLAVLQSAAKKRKDSIDAFKKGGRSDRAETEAAELLIIKEFLPAELSDDELDNLITEVIDELAASTPQDFGKVMKATVAKAGGRADGKRIAAIVNVRLKK